jgi:hypothetical protein
MSDTPPVSLKYEGNGVFKALSPFHAKRCDQWYELGTVYDMEPVEPRSMKSHRHEFAWLREAYLNLPEIIADNFIDEEYLRKFALIQVGYCHTRQYVLDSKKDAAMFAAALRDDNLYDVVSVSGPIVTRYTARSQATRGKDKMTATEFQDSKTKIIGYIAGMVGVTPEELVKNAGKEA